MDPATTQAVAKATEETAKTTGRALEIVHDTGGYLRGVFADLPADLVGVGGGAWLHEIHIRLRDKLRRRTEQILRERDVQEVIELSPNIAAALVAGAQEEGREELMELWARLLANAMDPNLNSVRHSFIDAVRKMDPLDAVVPQYIHQQNVNCIRRGNVPDGVAKQITGIMDISFAIGHRSDEVDVSIRHLTDLSFLDEIRANPAWWSNAISREFLRACYPEVKTE
jgi:Abortive infection alpha